MADDEDATPAGEGPAFGPSGYLPERASRRARKIVLRAPLGLQWVVGAALVGVLLVVAGVALLGEDTPPPPFRVAAEDVGSLPPSSPRELAGRDVLLVAAGGRPRAFLLPADGAVPSWCAASGLLETPDGQAWRATGRGVGGTPSLRELPAVVSGGALHVDPTSPATAARPDADGPRPACGPDVSGT